MAAALFIVLIPRKEHEEKLRKTQPNNTYQEPLNGVCESDPGAQKVCVDAQESFNIILSKCKSTDCLHNNGKVNGLYKCKSENVLSSSDFKGYVKTSWEELKQVMRPKRNKLKITSPFRGVDILVAFKSDTPLEIILSEVLKRLDIKNASWNSTKNNDFWQVIFSLESSNVCEETLQVLRTLGVGSRYQSSVSVIPCTLYYKNLPDERAQTPEFISDSVESNNTAWTRFTSSVRARTNLAQVLHDVRTDAALTFDWLFLLTVAAFVAAIGLVENSTVILVASMLISPLMGPITAGTLGTAVRDRSLQYMGVYNELLGLFLSLMIGFMFGMTICAVDEQYGTGEWPTYEMMSRCEIRSLWIGVLVAIPSGAGVALAVLGEYTASLVGVAISASLLPPAVNCGLLWAMALVHLAFLDDDSRWTSVIKSHTYSDNPAIELAVLGTVSLCLTLVNIVCIFLVGVAVYKVKEVSPLDRREISWWRANKRLLEASKRYDNQREGDVVPNNWNNVITRSEKDTQANFEPYDEPKTQCSEDSIDNTIVSDQTLADEMEDFYHRCRTRNLYIDEKSMNEARRSERSSIEMSANRILDHRKCNLHIASKSFHV